MARYTEYSNGAVYDTTTGHQVGHVLTPQGVKGINGPAFYTLAQMKPISAHGLTTVVKLEELPNGRLIGRRSLDEVVSEAL